MNKKFGMLIFALLILSSFASAHAVYYNQDSGDDYLYKEKISKTRYDSDDDYTVTRTIYVNYENPERLSTYEYRHGYSYRDTKEYWERHHDYYDIEDVKVIRTDEDYWYRNQDDYYDYDSRKDRYYDKYDRYDRYDKYDRYYDEDYRDYRYNYRDRPSYKYKYYDYLDEYEEVECYDYRPRDKLFYISCDDWLY